MLSKEIIAQIMQKILNYLRKQSAIQLAFQMDNLILSCSFLKRKITHHAHEEWHRKGVNDELKCRIS